MMKIDKTAVLDALPGWRVLAHHDVVGRRCGKWLRLRECPACGPTSSLALAVDPESGAYHCHRCGAAGGDVLALVALFEGLDVRADFGRVLELGAEIAGVVPGAPAVDAADRARQREAARERRAAEDRARRGHAHEIALDAWNRLLLDHDAGAAYLRSRGLGAILDRDDRAELVRFGPAGDVAVSMFELSTGRMISIARRLLEPGDRPKVLTLAGCPTAGACIGRPDLASTTGAIFVAEGVTDWLTATAVLECPPRLVLGASGTTGMVPIAAWVARQIAGDPKRMLSIVADNDEPGRRAGRAAWIAAADAGLAPERIELFGLGGQKDLNDALRAEAGDIREYVG